MRCCEGCKNHGQGLDTGCSQRQRNGGDQGLEHVSACVTRGALQEMSVQHGGEPIRFPCGWQRSRFTRKAGEQLAAVEGDPKQVERWGGAGGSGPCSCKRMPGKVLARARIAGQPLGLNEQERQMHPHGGRGDFLQRGLAEALNLLYVAAAHGCFHGGFRQCPGLIGVRSPGVRPEHREPGPQDPKGTPGLAIRHRPLTGGERQGCQLVRGERCACLHARGDLEMTDGITQTMRPLCEQSVCDARMQVREVRRLDVLHVPSPDRFFDEGHCKRWMLAVAEHVRVREVDPASGFDDQRLSRRCQSLEHLRL